MDVFVGMELFTTTNEMVKVVAFYDDEIDVESRGKIYRRKTSIIGVKLFVKEVIFVCMNCMLYRREDCFGNSQICDMFQYGGIIEKEEMDGWPKYGDATYLKLYGFSRYFDTIAR